MTNPCQEMTSYQEAMQELRDNVAYLKEQLREAVRLISVPAKGMTHEAYLKFRDDRDAFLAQNADIVKELEQ